MVIKIVNIILTILYFIFVILVARSDKKTKKLDKRILVYGVLVTVGSTILQYFMSGGNLNRVIIYLVLIVFLELLSIQITKKKKKYDYQVNLLVVLILYNLFAYELATIVTIGFTLIIIGLYIEINKTFNKNKKKNKEMEKVPVLYFMSIAHILALVFGYLYSLVSIF
jgi:hypothetical protein